jgi:hypothetical protein
MFRENDLVNAAYPNSAMRALYAPRNCLTCHGEDCHEHQRRK